MKKTLLLSIFFAFSISAFSQLFTVQSINVVTTTPDSCTAIQVDVTTFLGCINFVQGPSAYTVNGSNITIDVNYTSSPICAGAISNPVFNVSLMNIPAGTYTITTRALLDRIQTNSITTQNFVVASCSTVGLEDLNSATFEVYPNPTTDYLNIKSSTSNYEVKLMDIKGSRIENVQLINKGDLTSIDLSALNSGIYFLEFKSDNEMIVKKIIKQ